MKTSSKKIKAFKMRNEKKIVKVDVFSTLPPEILGIIYELIHIPHAPIKDAQPNHFRPLTRLALHFQRVNLYRYVTIRTPQSLLQFCRSISDRNELGGMVKEMSVHIPHGPEQATLTLDTIGMGKSLDGVDALMGLSFPHLISLDVLRLATIPGFQATQLLVAHLSLRRSCITDLTLFFEDYSFISMIIPMFPLLEFLMLDLPLTLPNATLATSTNQSFNPPPCEKSLCRLSIGANFESLAICNLIATTEAFDTALEGVNLAKGLRALSNSLDLAQLTVYDYDDTVAYLDVHLLKYTHLEQLTLDNIMLTNTFFAQFISPESPLESLHLRQFCYFSVSDLIDALCKKPPRLRHLQLDLLDEDDGASYLSADWPSNCDPDDVRAIREACEKAGIECDGTAVDAVIELDDFEAWEDSRETDPEDDDESETDESDPE